MHLPKPSPDTKSPGAITLDFPVSTIVRNQCLLFTTHPIYGIFVIEAEWTKTLSKESMNSLGSRRHFLHLDLPYKTSPLAWASAMSHEELWMRLEWPRNTNPLPVAMVQMLVSPAPLSNVEILTPKVMLLVGVAFGRWLCHEGRTLMSRVVPLWKTSHSAP